ncbi:MAG: transposase [Ktedonobacteraceae bacterium]|nr:transposase [Ktedonobacteraceae bacterium]
MFWSQTSHWDRGEERQAVGETARTIKLLLDLSDRAQGGANHAKRQALTETIQILDAARRFYLDFFLAHPDKLHERVEVISKKTGEVREALISADKLLTWAEYATVETEAHPDPLPDWNFNRAFPDFPNRYRRSVIKDCIGKARGYLKQYQSWQASGKKKGRPGVPKAANLPTLYAGTFSLEQDGLDLRQSFVRLKVYDGETWTWMNYPTRYNRYFEGRRTEPGWEQKSPKLVLSKQGAAIHFLQTKEIKAKKIVESKQDPDLVTVAVDLNVKWLAVITVRQHGKIMETVFVSDQGLDQHRYRHLKRIAKKQWQSGRAIPGERSNQQIWSHVRRMNTSVAHQVAARIVAVCEKYPGCVLLLERLRKMKPGKMSKSRRRNRKQANQLKGKIRDYSQAKAYAGGVVSCEVNAHGTSQFCSRCGARGERFSRSGTTCTVWRGGKLFRCPVCSYEAQADFNASVNVHHSFWKEWHWHPRKTPPQSRSG